MIANKFSFHFNLLKFDENDCYYNILHRHQPHIEMRVCFCADCDCVVIHTYIYRSGFIILPGIAYSIQDKHLLTVTWFFVVVTYSTLITRLLLPECIHTLTRLDSTRLTIGSHTQTSIHFYISI